MLLTLNAQGNCGCNPNEEIERPPKQPNPAFWTGYQSDYPYYL